MTRNDLKTLNEKFPAQKRKTMSFIYTEEFPYLEKLVAVHGNKQAGQLIGISDPNKMMRDQKVRPAYEMAAKLIMLEASTYAERTRALVITITEEEHQKALESFCAALGLDYMKI